MNERSEVSGKKLTSNGICERFGIVRRTLSRWMDDPEMQFPPSLVINHRHYWEESEIINWERLRASQTRRAA